MPFQRNRSHFSFSQGERNGIFFLVAIMVGIQVVRYGWGQGKSVMEPNILNAEMQTVLDSLKQEQLTERAPKFYPFNPNYISDGKGYALGLTAAQMDRLFQYRKEGKFVNSAQEFQTVTQIPDSLLAVLVPLFKFPEWTSTAKETRKEPEADHAVRSSAVEKKEPQDLNTASAEALQEISGIGEVLSQRIVKFRDRLGGFLEEEQLYDVYGLDPEVAKRALQKFEVKERPAVKPININTASAQEMAQLVYISYGVAQKIVALRENNQGIKSFEDLKDVEGFPMEKIDRIKLYLTL